LLDPSFDGILPYSKEELLAFAKILAPFFNEVSVRGI
jgi:hypothetical protein